MDEPWFEFEDDEGVGRCAPDGVILFSDHGVVLDAQLKYTVDKDRKLAQLYQPLCAEHFERPFAAAQIFKHPNGVDLELVGLEALPELKPLPGVHALHWMS